MTLKEKSEEAWNNYEYKKGNLYSNCFKDGFEQGAKIADDFAIGFADWMFRTAFNKEIDWSLTTKELLQIYKKEKGL